MCLGHLAPWTDELLPTLQTVTANCYRKLLLQTLNRWSKSCRALTSTSFLAEISIRSPRKLFIFIIQKKKIGSKYPKNNLFNLEKGSTGAHGLCTHHNARLSYSIPIVYYYGYNNARCSGTNEKCKCPKIHQAMVSRNCTCCSTKSHARRLRGLAYLHHIEVATDSLKRASDVQQIRNWALKSDQC